MRRFVDYYLLIIIVVIVRWSVKSIHISQGIVITLSTVVCRGVLATISNVTKFFSTLVSSPSGIKTELYLPRFFGRGTIFSF